MPATPKLALPLLIAITDRRLLKLSPENWAHDAIAGGVDVIQVREKDLDEPELVEFVSRVLNGTSSVGERAPGLRPRDKKHGHNLEEVCSGVAWGVNPGSGVANERPSPGPAGPPSPAAAGEGRSLDSSLVSEETSLCEHGVFRPVLSPQPQVQLNNAPNVARLLDCGLHLPESEPIPDRFPTLLSRSVHSIESARQSAGVDFLIAGHVFATPSKSGLEPRGLDWLASIAFAVELPVIAIGGITASNAASCIEHGASGIAVVSAIAASDEPRAAAAALRSAIDRAWEQRHG